MLHILYCNYYVVINRNGGYNAGIYCIAVVIILLYILFLWLGMGMLLCISQKRKVGNLAFGMRRDMYGTDWKYLDDDSSVFAAGDLWWSDCLGVQ